MKIQDALNETGKAEHDYYPSMYARNIGGVLCWFYRKGNSQGPCIGYTWILDNNWTTYHPTPEKCEACEDAQVYEYGISDSKHPGCNKCVVEHLRRYHCTCKKEKP